MVCGIANGKGCKIGRELMIMGVSDHVHSTQRRENYVRQDSTVPADDRCCAGPISGSSNAPLPPLPLLTAAQQAGIRPGTAKWLPRSGNGISTPPKTHQRPQPTTQRIAPITKTGVPAGRIPAARPTTAAPRAPKGGSVVVTPALARPGGTAVLASGAQLLRLLQKPSAGGVEALIRAGYPAKDPSAAPPTYHVVTPSCADPGECSYAVQYLKGGEMVEIESLPPPFHPPITTGIRRCHFCLDKAILHSWNVGLPNLFTKKTLAPYIQQGPFVRVSKHSPSLASKHK